MAGIDLAAAQAKLDVYLAAETKILAGQDVTIAGVRFTRADLAAVQKGIEIWNQRVQQLAGAAASGGRVVRRVVPLS